MSRKALVAALFATTLGAGPVMAQSGSQSEAARLTPAPQPDYITASMLEDARIVSLEGNYDEKVWDDEAPLAAMVAGLTEIGEVDEVVLTPKGVVQGLTTDVGGFIGIGQKAVMIPLEDIRLARPSEGSDEVTVVTRLDRDRLEGLPEFGIDD